MTKSGYIIVYVWWLKNQFKAIGTDRFNKVKLKNGEKSKKRRSIKIAVKVLFNTILASVFFMAGIWLFTINISFGLMSIVGGLLFGFSSLRTDVATMNKKTKLIFFGTFISCLSLFSITFLILIKTLLSL